jgi:hypothetical protein
MTDWFLSRTTHSSSFNPKTSPQSSSPICVRVLVRVSGVVGTIENVFFVYRVLPSEHLVVVVHAIFDRGLVSELVDHDRNHFSEGVGVKINF